MTSTADYTNQFDLPQIKALSEICDFSGKDNACKVTVQYILYVTKPPVTYVLDQQ